MKEVIVSFLALPFLVQGVAILVLSTLLSIGRNAWYRLFYRKGWYPGRHYHAFHWPPMIIIALVAGMLLALSEQLAWLLAVTTVIFFFLFDAPLMKAQYEHK